MAASTTASGKSSGTLFLSPSFSSSSTAPPPGTTAGGSFINVSPLWGTLAALLVTMVIPALQVELRQTVLLAATNLGTCAFAGN